MEIFGSFVIGLFLGAGLILCLSGGDYRITDKQAIGACSVFCETNDGIKEIRVYPEKDECICGNTGLFIINKEK